MDPRAIGVFDSGIGGLMAVRMLRHLLPGEPILYLDRKSTRLNSSHPK